MSLSVHQAHADARIKGEFERPCLRYRGYALNHGAIEDCLWGPQSTHQVAPLAASGALHEATLNWA